MAEYAPDQNFKHPVCRGSWALGNNCKVCERCQATHPGRAGTQLLTNPQPTDTSRSGDLVDDDFAPIWDESILLAEHEAVQASVAVGGWLSAALDDPNVCDAMKADINRWFSAGFLYLDEVRKLMQTDRIEALEAERDRLREALSRYDVIDINGKKYRKFIPFPEPVNDGTSRCIQCGQIDEPEYHDDDLCRAALEASDGDL